jgi:hypothetical protein
VQLLEQMAAAYLRRAQPDGLRGGFADPPDFDPAEPMAKLLTHRLRTLLDVPAASANYRYLAVGEQSRDVSRSHNALLIIPISAACGGVDAGR